MAKKRKQDDPLATLMEAATKEKLVKLLVGLASTRPNVRCECLDYLNRHTALSPIQKKQSEGEKLLSLWDELAPDLDELDSYGGGDDEAEKGFLNRCPINCGRYTARQPGKISRAAPASTDHRH